MVFNMNFSLDLRYDRILLRITHQIAKKAANYFQTITLINLSTLVLKVKYLEKAYLFYRYTGQTKIVVLVFEGNSLDKKAQTKWDEN